MMKEKFVNTVLSLEDIPQSPKWHPEGNTLEHVKFIIYGLNVKNQFGYISHMENQFLQWVALFHDLGKIDTLTFDDDGNPHAYGHEYKAKNYINKYEDIIPYEIDVDKLKKFCAQHMRAHLTAGQKMGIGKKKAFKESFSQKDFYLMMSFESCDSAHSMYEFLRRTPAHVDDCYLAPIEFYDKIRPTMELFFDNDFEHWLDNKINND